MSFGDVTIMINDIPAKAINNNYLNQLSKEEKFQFIILHTTAKFAFNNFLRIKINDYVNQTNLAEDDLFNLKQNLNMITNDLIDYFIKDKKSFKQLLNKDIDEDDFERLYDKRYEIIKK